MRDWVAFMKSKLDSDLWGFVATDYYYHRRLSDNAQGPEQFLLEMLPELTQDLKVGPAAFHQVLMNVAMQLLGNDFVAVMNISCEAIRLMRDRLDGDSLHRIVDQYRIYGHERLLVERLHGLGVNARAVEEQNHANGLNGLKGANMEVSVVTQNVEMVDRTVVEIDLVGYSTMARLLEENTSAATVAELNSQIQALIDTGLAEIGISRSVGVMATTGDGAILLLNSAEAAHIFAGTIHRASEERNRGVMEAGAKRWFRAGAATGQLARRVLEGGQYDYAGGTIAKAVRLEAASRPGEFLIDVRTYDMLPQHLRSLYSPEETVVGKRDEKFLARRWKVAIDAPLQVRDTTPSPSPSRPAGPEGRRLAIVQMDDIEEAELDKLIILTEMPYEKKPSRSEALEQRKGTVLSWATSPHGCGMPRLLDELSFIMQTRSSGVTTKHS